MLSNADNKNCLEPPAMQRWLGEDNVQRLLKEYEALRSSKGYAMQGLHEIPEVQKRFNKLISGGI